MVPTFVITLVFMWINAMDTARIWNLTLTDDLLNEYRDIYKVYESSCDQQNYTLHVETDLPVINKCDTLNLCNSTFCMRINYAGGFWTRNESKHVNFKFNPDNAYQNYIILPPSLTGILNLTMEDGQAEKYLSMMRSDPLSNYMLLPHPLYLDWDLFFKMYQLQETRKEVYSQFSTKCLFLPKKEIIITGVGDLPNGCTKLIFCASQHCLLLDYLTPFNGEMRLRESPVHNTTCKTQWTKVRHRRSPLKLNHDGLVRFNLPGYRYCGPGTDIEKADDQGGPIDDLDEACRDHDIDYMTGADPTQADLRFLERVQQVSPNIYPLFWTVFKTKTLFEEYTGHKYTSFLYFYTKGFQPSLTLHLYTHNSFIPSRTNATSREVAERENRWTHIIHGIWEGYCMLPFNKVSPEFIRQANGDEDEPTPGTSTGSETVNRQESSKRPREESDEEETAYTPGCESEDAEDTYPKPPRAMGCYLLLNEYLPSDSAKEDSFIEHVRVCKRKTRAVTNRLTGYVEIILQAGEAITQIVFADFKGYDLQQMSEESLPGERKRYLYFFLLGTSSYLPDMETTNAQISRGDYRGLPSAVAKTICIILLYIPSYSKRSKVVKSLHLQTENGNYIPTPFSLMKEMTVKKYLQDVLIVGPPCSEEDCGLFFDLLSKKPHISTEDGMLIPIPYDFYENNSRQDISINRCARNGLPMQQETYAPGSPTPKLKNNCPVSKVRPLMSLHGRPLQRTAQRIIMNVLHFFRKYGTDMSRLQGDSVTKTSTVTGVNTLTIKQVQNNYRREQMTTPGKKRFRRVCPVMNQFDSFRVDHVRRIVQGYYEKNVPPLIPAVFEDLKKQIKEEEEGLIARGLTPKPFKCSERSFRKFMRSIGFKYGRINNRDVILMRDDIVAKRFKYIETLRRNRISPNPLPIIYTDETWIDPFARTGKAWVPRKCDNYRERAKYTYQKNKVGKGPRIIVLHAGGSEGFVPGIMRVYPVSKNKVTDDYHDNVNGEVYLRWFTELLEILKDKGPHIIVIDNAPYHSKADVPKSSDRKPVMYEWLKENLPEEKKADFKPISQYLKPQLWNMIKEMKKDDKYYVIDKLAAQYGHQILRLPPYNCDLNPIEYVWKDVKHEVRKGNTQQNVAAVQVLAENVMNSYTSDQWKQHVNHVNRLENEYWKNDGQYDRFLDNQQQIIIPIGPDNEDTDSEVESSEGSDEEISSDATEPEDECPDIHSVVHDDHAFQEQPDECPQTQFVPPRRVLTYSDADDDEDDDV